jgi:hypothetical protein
MHTKLRIRQLPHERSIEEWDNQGRHPENENEPFHLYLRALSWKKNCFF